MIDFLIVGAGLFGATCAQRLTERGYHCLVIERREEVGGNCADEMVNGIRVQKHGGHIFHTNSRRIWEYVNRFAAWKQYTHRVAAFAQGRLYSFPVNIGTLQEICGIRTPKDAQKALQDRQIREKIFRLFFEGYSRKQWGKIPDGSVLERIPWRATYDDRYFTDLYQGLPEDGYSAMIKNMLGDIPRRPGVDFCKPGTNWLVGTRHVIFTGGIDELFWYDMGHLEYRSLSFTRREINIPDYQGCATVNYCDFNIPWTRVNEWKHFGWQKSDSTVITFEFPAKHIPGENEPYYPVADEANKALYAKYKARADKLPWLSVGGRLGSYQYLNMDQTVAQALALCDRLTGKEQDMKPEGEA